MVVIGALVVQMGSALPELFLKTITITYLYLTLLEKNIYLSSIFQALSQRRKLKAVK